MISMDAAQYLRKSRMEEGMDTEEVLAKHRKDLSRFAADNDIHIIESYDEVVSGESLYARPEMLRLLEDVEEGRYDAGLVMDLDRLWTPSGTPAPSSSPRKRPTICPTTWTTRWRSSRPS